MEFDASSPLALRSPSRALVVKEGPPSSRTLPFPSQEPFAVRRRVWSSEYPSASRSTSSPPDRDHSVGVPVSSGRERGERGVEWTPGTQRLRDLIRPHIDAFNRFVEPGLLIASESIDPVEIVHEDRVVMKFWLEDIALMKPRDSRGRPILPYHCREASSTYRGELFATVCRELPNGTVTRTQRKIGTIPIMVGSLRCHLDGLSPRELVEHREDAMEMGGYFILNGNEKCIRLLVIARRNYPLAIERSSFANRGSKFSHFGVLVRCVSDQLLNITNVLHYLTTGTMRLGFTISRQQFFLPVILLLKSLHDVSDKEIFEDIICDAVDHTFVAERLEANFHEHRDLYTSCTSRTACLKFLGSRFRARISVPVHASDVEVGERVLRDHILVHLASNTDKYRFLILMIRKLLALTRGDILADSVDSPINQEILLGGDVYFMLFRDKLIEYLETFRALFLRDVRLKGFVSLAAETDGYLKSLLDKNNMDVGRKLEYFLATGNLVSNRLQGLGQTAGFSIVAEKLNMYRYISHFRSVHRGQVFTQMRTTSVRRLLPDAWGFFCPVHTPDGAPCGLLNHLTAVCRIVSDDFVDEDRRDMSLLCAGLGMNPVTSGLLMDPSELPVLLDGALIGYVKSDHAEEFCETLRLFKIQGENQVPWFLEICLLPRRAYGSFPGIYLFASMSRMMRPVLHLATGKVEWIGSLEQAYMEIACLDEDMRPGYTTHREISSMHMLSVVASLTPFSDFNQSPRNMYQCQMGKQSMSTPCHNFPYRADNKMYRIMFPQTPICRTALQDAYEIDNYPHGTNAVIAVISYTGYDMEDAMIINKSSYDRGFGHGVVYVTSVVDLREEGTKSADMPYFSNNLNGSKVCDHLDWDGLPCPGTLLQPGDALYCVYDPTKKTFVPHPWKKGEAAKVDSVKVVGEDNSSGTAVVATIKLRIDRNPVIGDKFSSRHGQKGTLSLLWPAEDMPFTETGMTPDVIINPHAFPSRMTIGMLIEIAAAKAGALHGKFQNATPFRFNEETRAVDYYGEELIKAGYSYYGNETLYCGSLGTVMKADIFFGICYYQRLRHMVKDKFQVRSTGPVDSITQQPVKGRKAGGGIRFGEMERDSLLAHGVSFYLLDRLFHSSDEREIFACKACGSLNTVINDRESMSHRERRLVCSFCLSRNICSVRIPYVFSYLISELAAMNIRLTADIK